MKEETEQGKEVEERRQGTDESTMRPKMQREGRDNDRVQKQQDKGQWRRGGKDGRHKIIRLLPWHCVHTLVALP